MEIFNIITSSLFNVTDFFLQSLPPEVLPSESAEVVEKFKPLGAMKLAHWEDLLEMMIRLSVHMLFITLLVRFIYYPLGRSKDFLFTYFLFSISIFLMCFMLESVKLEMGFALGLFAVFGIIRYRTDAIPIKEMTYLFIVIGMSVMNALINKKISLVELVFANLAIIGLTYGLEKVWLLRHESQKIILYDNIHLIQTARHDELRADLELRTGIKINRVEIGKIDFLRDTALIKIYFFDDEQPSQMDETFSQNING